MKLTRHNGRAGKNGVYNPKHNDRSFDLKNSGHIDAERAKFDLYWDCYNGITSPVLPNPEEELATTFEEVEKKFYSERYQNYVEGQNQRNIKSRHPERNRTTDDIRLHKKTCPEESLYQIGTREKHVDADLLVAISTQFFEEFQARFGEHIHLLDWALHVDEETPHIHERHVFDCENEYGELFPQQEKALEALGFELPDSEKKAGRYNNRKMTFDATCRTLLFDICKEHGLLLEEEPSYGGRAYLEKQDYIRMKQQKIIEEQNKTIQVQEENISEGKETLAQQDELFMKNAHRLFIQEEIIEDQDKIIEEQSLKISDVDALIDEVSDIAYEKAVQAVTNEVVIQTHERDIELAEGTKKWIQDPARKASTKEKNYALKRIDGLIDKINRVMESTIIQIKSKLMKPEIKEPIVNQIKQEARPSIMTRLKRKQQEISQREAGKGKTIKNKEQEL